MGDLLVSSLDYESSMRAGPVSVMAMSQPCLAAGSELTDHFICFANPPSKGYMRLVDHALAQGEVRVGEVGEGLQQDLGSDCGLKEGWIELVPREGNNIYGSGDNSSSPNFFKCQARGHCFSLELGSWTCLGSNPSHSFWLTSLSSSACSGDGDS